jgi:hypothetical protein
MREISLSPPSATRRSDAHFDAEPSAHCTTHHWYEFAKGLERELAARPTAARTIPDAVYAAISEGRKELWYPDNPGWDVVNEWLRSSDGSAAKE